MKHNSRRNSKLIKNGFAKLFHCRISSDNYLDKFLTSGQQIQRAHPTAASTKCLSLDDLQTGVWPICKIKRFIGENSKVLPENDLENTKDTDKRSVSLEMM